MSRLKPYTLSLLAAAAFAPLAHADDSAASDKQRIEELEQRLLILERKLEIQNEEAATKAKDAPITTAGDKGFSLKSAKGDYELKFTALAQVDGRYFVDDDGAFRDGFVTRRLRPTLQGTLGKLVTFRFTPEFAGANGVGDGGATSAIVDAYFDLRFSPYASLRIGKQKGPIGLERLQSGGSIELIERGFATELAPNRDLGVTLFGEALKGTVSYTLGVFNGTADGRDVSVADDGKKEFAGRIFAEPFKNDYGFFKGLGLGLAGSTGTKDGTGANLLPRYRTPGQNVFFNYGETSGATGTFATGKHSRYSPQAWFYRNQFGLLAEYLVSTQEIARTATGPGTDVKNQAWQLTTSLVLTGEDAGYKGIKPANPYTLGGEGWGAVELVARAQSLSIDDDAFTGTAATRLANLTVSAKRATSYGLGVNWVLTPNAKLSADYNLTRFDAGGGGTVAAPLDRRDEKALFTRLSIQY